MLFDLLSFPNIERSAWLFKHYFKSRLVDQVLLEVGSVSHRLRVEDLGGLEPPLANFSLTVIAHQRPGTDVQQRRSPTISYDHLFAHLTTWLNVDAHSGPQMPSCITCSPIGLRSPSCNSSSIRWRDVLPCTVQWQVQISWLYFMTRASANDVEPNVFLALW